MKHKSGVDDAGCGGYHVRVTGNEIRVLEAVASIPKATRRLIARHTGLGLVAVGSTLSDLESRGCVARAPGGAERSGRPAFVYSLGPEIGGSIGVSVEPQGIRVVLVDAAGNLDADHAFPLTLSPEPSPHADQVIHQIRDRLSQVLTRQDRPVLSMGLTLPGVTDADQGIWVKGLQVSGISHVNLRNVVSDLVGVPVLIEGPARTVAFHELTRGQGRGLESFVLLYLGYGVGSAMVLGGRLYRGHNGLSGEIGHLVVDPDGYRCSCGDVGCLETIASSTGILRLLQDRLSQGVVSALSAPGPLSIERVLSAADAGDRLSQTTLHEVGEHIGRACTEVIKLINPQRLLVSGSCSLFRAYFEPRIQMMIQRHVIPEMLEGFDVRFAAYDPSCDALGAALMSREVYWRGQLAHLRGAADPAP